MSSDPNNPEPEPIEAEFEPTGAGGDASPGARGVKAARRRKVGWAELGGGMVVAALAGAGIATVMTGGSTGSSTGPLAREVNSLSTEQQALVTRADQVSQELVALRARVDAQADQLASLQSGDQEMRQELNEAMDQIGVLTGEGESGDVTAVSSNTPLGRLLARIDTLEETINEEASSPQTTRQMQRSLRNLTQRVEALDEASVDLTTASERRRASIAALEQGLERIQAEFNSMREQFASVEDVESEIGAVRQSVTALAESAEADRAPIIAAAEESRAIRAVAAVEAAANKGGAFVQQHRTLAGLFPDDPDVEAMREIARRGAPTVEQLRTEFSRAADRAEQIAAGQVNDGWGWLRGAMSGIVTVRRTDADEATLQIISSARAALARGEVAEAVETIERLEGEAAGAMNGWLSNANRRAELDDRLASMNERLLSPVGENGN